MATEDGVDSDLCLSTMRPMRLITIIIRLAITIRMTAATVGFASIRRVATGTCVGYGFAIKDLIKYPRYSDETKSPGRYRGFSLL